MISQRDLQSYFAGAALAFGVILLTIQIITMLFGGLSEAELLAKDSLIWNIIYVSNLAGGLLGGNIVARHQKKDYTQTGVIVGILAYVFEFTYSKVIDQLPIDIWSSICLILGGIIGAILFRVRMESGRITKSRSPSKNSLTP